MNEESMSRRKGDRHVVAMRKRQGVTEAQKEVRRKENRNITPVYPSRIPDSKMRWITVYFLPLMRKRRSLLRDVQFHGIDCIAFHLFLLLLLELAHIVVQMVILLQESIRIPLFFFFLNKYSRVQS